MHIRFHDNDIRYVTIYFNHFPRHILRIFDFPIYCKHVANVPKKKSGVAKCTKSPKLSGKNWQLFHDVGALLNQEGA